MVPLKKTDLISGIVLFALGVGICLKSLTYPIGSFRSPGGGLFPLLASIILMALSGIMIGQALSKREAGETKRFFFPAKETPKRIILGFVALLGYRYLLPVIGFGPSTFFFILFLARILGHYSWKISLFFAVLTAVLAYYLFQVWLKIPMPPALLKF